MTHNQDEGMPPLPLAWEFVYEFPSPMGGVHRKLTPNRWNGSRPSASFLVYRADQMREYGRACMPAWQPIETAPMSAHPVLVFNENKRISIETGCYIHNMLHAAKLDGESCFYTYWMPLPKAPTPPQGSDHE